MVNPNKLCFGCMKEVREKHDKRCPCCGFDADAYCQSPRCLAMGTILAGKYLLGRVLGEGGFGITYIGLDLNMETVIAIKEYFPVNLVSRDITTSSKDNVIISNGPKEHIFKRGLKRFVDEARNVSSFSGEDGIVSVKDFFYENQTAYMVMEYIEGVSLKEYLDGKKGRIPEKDALELVKPVINSLRKVHQKGIIHRDLSPDNIMISKSGEVKLIDFGAARMTAGQDQKSMTIILKHGYAPEEQYRTHGEQGPWTDVYGMCACLYRMIMGETLVPAMDRMFQDCIKTFESCHVQVSSQTEQAIMKGLAVKKENRIRDMSELYRILYEGKKIPIIKGKRAGIFASFFIGVILMVALLYGYMKVTAHTEVGPSANMKTEIINRQPEEETMVSEKLHLTEESFDKDQGSLSQSVLNEYRIPYSTSNSWYSALFCRLDGSVEYVGNNTYGEGDVENWRDIVAVAGNDTHSLGLKRDGYVISTGKDDDGECSVESWSGIIAIAAGEKHSLGLKKDGTVISTGSNEKKQCEVGDWGEIIAIAADQYYSVGLQKDGTVLVTGDGEESRVIANWPDVTYLELSDEFLYGYSDGGPIQTKCLKEEIYSTDHYWYMIWDFWKKTETAVHSWKDVVHLNALEYNVVAVKKDGTVQVAYGSRNDAKYLAAENWNNMQSTAICTKYVIGVQTDEKILYPKDDNYNIPAISSMKEIYVTEGGDICLAGVNRQGRIVFNVDGHDKDSIEYYNEAYALDKCENVIQLSMKDYNFSAITSDGKLFLFSIADELPPDVTSVPGAIQVSSCEEGTAVLFDDGTVKTWVYEDYLGWDYDDPGMILIEKDMGCENWSEIKQIWMVKENGTGVIGLTKEGSLLFSDGLDMGAMLSWDNIKVMDYDVVSNHAAAICNDGRTLYYGEASDGQSNMAGWNDVSVLKVSGNHTVGLKSDGTVVASGRNKDGRCDVGSWSDITFISTGAECTLGIDKDGNVLIAGNPYARY